MYRGLDKYPFILAWKTCFNIYYMYFAKEKVHIKFHIKLLTKMKINVNSEDILYIRKSFQNHPQNTQTQLWNPLNWCPNYKT